MKGMRLNDEERRLWVLNDENLYSAWNSYARLNHAGEPTRRGRTMRAFLKENRDFIDSYIKDRLGAVVHAFPSSRRLAEVLMNNRCKHDGCHVPVTKNGSCGNHKSDMPIGE